MSVEDRSPKPTEELDLPGPRDEKRYVGLVSRRLRSCRSRAGLTLSRFATAIARHLNTVKNWENDDHPSLPGAKDLVPITQTLRVSIDWLLSPLNHADSNETSPFVVDETVVRRQLAASSTRDPIWRMAAWFVLDEHSRVVHGADEVRELQARIDAHVRALDASRPTENDHSD